MSLVYPPKKKTLSMHVFGPRNSAYTVNLTYETYRQPIYIQVKKKAFKINAKIEDVGLNED